MKWIFKTALSVTALASLASAQDAASNFRVYGFLDASASWRQVNNGYTEGYLGKDTLGLNLTHANIYFDWTPNQYTKALIEIGVLPKTHLDMMGNSSSAAVITYQGQAMTDDQIYQAFATQAVATAVTQQVTQALAGTGATAAMIQQQVTQQMATQAVQDQITAAEAQAQAKLGPTLAQLRASNSAQSSSTASAIDIDRAYFDLILNDKANLRIGKWITPSGVWNVDHGSPVVLTVSQPYETTDIPVFPEAQTGLMFFGREYLGDHDLNYNAWVSTGRSGPSQSFGLATNNSVDKVEDLTLGGHVDLHLDILKSVTIGATAQTGKIREEYTNTALNIDVNNLENMTISDYTQQEEFATNDREHIMGGDMKVEVGNVLLQGEVNYDYINNESTGKNSDILGYYGLLAYKIPVGTKLLVTPYGMFEELVFHNAMNTPGIGLYGYGARGFASILGGVNFSLFSNVRIKLEYNYVRILESNSEVGASFGYMPMGFTPSQLAAHIVSAQFALAF
jgi:hypothetical protein